MSQYPNDTTQSVLLSNTPVLICAGACQLTSVRAYNSNNVDVWFKCYDAPTAASTPTGGTCAVEFMIPAGAQLSETANSGNTIDPDGLWSFARGLVVRCVTSQTVTSNTAPQSSIDFRLQYKP